MGCYTHFFVIFIVLVNAVNFPALCVSFSRSGNEEVRGPRATSTLKFLVVVTRHGNRSPLYGLGNLYPNNNSTYWPFGDGLTKRGRNELYNMGKKLSSLYKGFLGTQFFNNEVYVSSTDVTRVIQSGKCLMAGLYVPTDGQIWNQNLLWQPVPVHLDSLDKTEAASMGCNRFTTEQTAIKAVFAKKWADNITYYTDYVNKAINTSVSGTFGIVEIWDTLLSVANEGYTLPDWAAELYPDGMYPMMNDQYIQYVTGTDELVRLVIGPFFAEMMTVIESKINGTLSPDRQLYYYSGHDDTIITLQAALGVPQDEIVGVVYPGSAIVVEIHQNTKTKKYFVEAIYIDGNDPDLNAVGLNIPDCGSPCNFQKFKKNSAKFTNVTAENYSAECNT